MTILHLKQFRLFPENHDELGTATHAFERPGGMVAQFGKGLEAEIGKLVVLPLVRQVLHRIKLRSISRQILQADRTEKATRR